MSSCTEWGGYTNSGGYGSRTVNGKVWLAHRYAWTEECGPIPEGLDVLHSCDNPPCYNVEHLFLGTDLDNAADSIAKGRRPRATHGSSGMYNSHGCRCGKCRKGIAQRRKEWRKRRKADVVGVGA